MVSELKVFQKFLVRLIDNIIYTYINFLLLLQHYSLNYTDSLYVSRPIQRNVSIFLNCVHVHHCTRYIRLLTQCIAFDILLRDKTFQIT